MKSQPVLRWVLALLMVAALGSPAAAQTIYGSLAGTVTDASGAVVPGADVIIRSMDQGLTRELKTDETGFWRAPSLPIGRYQLEVSAKGFEKVIRGPLTVEASVERAVDVTLKPSGTQEVITITEEAPLIEATKAQISRGVEARRILELPGLNTLTGLALLQPGVTGNNAGRPGSGFVVNGARTRSNNFMLDGANNNDQSLSIPRQTPAPEYLGEFRIITNTFSAEYGRNSGSVVMQVTKSGTNEFHGVLRWSWLGNGLNAFTTDEQRTYAAQRAAGASDYDATRRARGVLVRNQFLGSVGGPIIKNRLFFFGGYDLDRRRSTANPVTTTFSQEGWNLLTQHQNSFAPGAVAFLRSVYPVANDPTPRGTVSVSIPAGPTLVIPIQQYRRGAGQALPYGRDINRGLMRYDWRVTDKDNIQMRWLTDDDTDPGVPAALEVNQLGQVIINHNATINHIRVWNPALVMETRLSYARRDARFTENFPPQFSITGSGLPTIGNQNFPQYRVDNLYELTNNWSQMKSKHTLRYGFNYLQYRLGSFFAPATRGVITYLSLADYLFDRNAQFTQYSGEAYVPAKTHEFQGFFADDYRITNNLMLNIGIRYEYTSAPFGFFSNAKADINNWAPRFGFAWSPKANDGLLGWISGGGKFVLRGGYAISYDQVFQNILLNTSRNFPRGVNFTFANLNGAQLWDPARRPTPPPPSQFTGDPRLLPYRYFSLDKRIQQPYSQQVSFGFERQLTTDYAFKLFYVGTRGVRLVREAERNLGFFDAAVRANPTLLEPVVRAYGMQPTTVSAQPAWRVDPTRASVLVGDGYGMSNFHSMQLTVEKRFSKGYQFEANYTWSTFISENDDILGGQVNRTLPSVPFNMRLDKARSGFDTPHRFVLNGIYQFPEFFKQRGLWGRIVDGWSISGIATMQQGWPYSILNANNPLGILPGQIATIHLSQRAGFNPNGNFNTGTSPTEPNPMWIAYPNNSGLIGAGANIRRVGNTYNADAALVKRVRTFGESQNLELRWEVFNVFNYRNFNELPANTISANTNNVTLMNLGFTNVGGRSMIFMARYNF